MGRRLANLFGQSDVEMFEGFAGDGLTTCCSVDLLRRDSRPQVPVDQECWLGVVLEEVAVRETIKLHLRVRVCMELDDEVSGRMPNALVSARRPVD